jgi:hypothetical protein
MTGEDESKSDVRQGEIAPQTEPSVALEAKLEVGSDEDTGGLTSSLNIDEEQREVLLRKHGNEELVHSGLDAGDGHLLAESMSMEAGKLDKGKKQDCDVVECRICQEEDELANLDTPCACTGSVKYAHPKCVQRWSNEKGNAVCEICHQPYKGYTAVPRVQPPANVGLPLEFTDEWALAAGQRLGDPRLLQQYTLDMDYNEYEAHASTTAWCRSAALIFMALLLLRHALGMIAAGDDDDESPAIFTVFLLKAIGFILPCYIMARAISVAQRRRQQQDAMAYFVQQGHVRGVPIVMAPRRLPEGVV